jgi:hypothetical protein
VPRYDFNWQITYELARSQLLPKGTGSGDHAPPTLGQRQFNPDQARTWWGRSDLGRDDDRLLLERAAVG